MAELKIEVDERPGILKEIDEGALDLVFSALQQDIYSQPIPSFIRETVSNGLDSIVERDIACRILRGEVLEEDHYLQRTDGALLKDSSFDRTYYNTKNLSSDSRVYVEYKEEHPRDKVSITDYGVGLAGSRLQGYFKIGYSSKRNMKDVIGKFGSGSKSALATGVDYFIMTTVYNGFKTSFMIFKNDYEAITPQHPSGKSEVWNVKMRDHSLHAKTIYWEPSPHKNSVTVELEVKKHNKNAYINAVKNQFQYFNGRVRITHPNSAGNTEVNHLNEKPLFESDNILIPKYSTYSVPHILVDGISYGPINFPELELEKMQGKIAIKVRATDVDITQSRENLKYTEKTKKTILDKVALARLEATDYVTDMMNVLDPENIFMVNNVYGKMSKDGSSPVAQVFSKFLSMHNIKPKYEFALTYGAGEQLPKPIKARLDSTLYEFLFYKFSVREVSTKLDGRVLKIESEIIDNWQALRNKKIVYARESNMGPKLANHLLEKYSAESIIYIRERPDRTKSYLEYYGGHRTYAVTAYMHTILEKNCHLNLDTYEVKYDEKEVGTEEKDNIVSTELTPAQERRLNAEVLYTTYVPTMVYEYSRYTGNDYVMSRDRDRTEVKLSKLGSHLEKMYENVIVCTGGYSDLAKFIEAAKYLSPVHDTDDQIVFIAQDKVKHFAPHGIMIDDYFRTVNTKTGELVIGQHIRDLNTLRILHNLMDKYPDYSRKFQLLKSFGTLPTGKLSSMWQRGNGKTIKQMMTEVYKTDITLVDEIFQYLEVLENFHNVVKTGNKDEISEKALQYFKSDEIYTIDAYDEELITMIEEEFERLHNIAPLMEVLADNELDEVATKLLEELITLKRTQHESTL